MNASILSHWIDKMNSWKFLWAIHCAAIGVGVVGTLTAPDLTIAVWLFGLTILNVGAMIYAGERM